jgi:lipoprotein NlpI
VEEAAPSRVTTRLQLHAELTLLEFAPSLDRGYNSLITQPHHFATIKTAMRHLSAALAAIFLSLVVAQSAAAQSNRIEQLLASAGKALESHENDTALRLTNDALAIAPKNIEVLTFRSQVHNARHDFAAAIADLDEVIAIAPRYVAAYDARGKAKFFAGDFAGSVADFDKYLELRPAAAPAHWQRGLSLYYAGEFEKGRDQFIAYQQVNDSDVENSVWQYLCNENVVGKEKAVEEFPVTGVDRRVPLMKIYDLFTGKGTVEDVIKAASDTSVKRDEVIRRHFYSNLYLGLYYVSEDQPEKALEHLKGASDPRHEFADYNYMWHVARIHAKLLEDAQKNKGEPKPDASPKTEAPVEAPAPK